MGEEQIPIHALKYLSSFHRTLAPPLEESYYAFTRLSAYDQAILDGLIQMLAPKCGGWLGAWELVSKLGIWLAKQPELR